MKEQLKQLIVDAFAKIPNMSCGVCDLQVTRTRDRMHGDFTCNIAMQLAKEIKKDPRELANLLVHNLPESDVVEDVQVAGAGFINFFLTQKSRLSVVSDILQVGKRYGCSDLGAKKKILLEFVSANPTGPLHVGHGRGAVYGSVLANLFKAIGYQVTQEYYVNDAGRQMDILMLSIWFRYLERFVDQSEFPENLYQGDYIKDIAEKLFCDRQQEFFCEQSWPSAMTDNDPEIYIDQLISFAQSTLGSDGCQTIMDIGLEHILSGIKQDLKQFDVEFDRWTHEKLLLQSGSVEECISKLQAGGFLYEKEGALWFRTTEFGDDKDRVVVRENGKKTYFASDIAYHFEKFSHEYYKIINVWGADHHGYIARIKAALTALGKDADVLEIFLVQFVSLYRGQEKLPMSTRSGQFITLQALQDEVGIDATRFFFIMRKNDQFLDFDLELAKSQSNENPIFYIQYAHARICSVFAQNNAHADYNSAPVDLSLLTEEHEERLILALSRYPEVVLNAAKEYAPHNIAYYLKEIANEFHSYYNACPFLVDLEDLRNARLSLIAASRQVIANGLSILGVSAPEKM